MLTALASLTFNQRAAIVMRELEGRSYQEIAGVLDLSVSAVEALLFRARRRLQLNRKALGILGTVPLPGSLTSFLGAGGGAVAAGGAAIGADLVLKAAAVVAAGAVTAGVGYKSVEALTAPPAPAAAAMKARPAPRSKTPAAVGKAQPIRADVSASRKKLRRAAPSTRPSRFGRPYDRQPGAGADRERWRDRARCCPGRRRSQHRRRSSRRCRPCRPRHPQRCRPRRFRSRQWRRYRPCR